MGEDGCVVRLRGLPWSATNDDIVSFFADQDVKIAPNGIHFTFSREGRPSGEAFVELISEEHVERALNKHKEHMGQRYIEVFHSKLSEMDWVVKRSGRNQPQSSCEAVLRLRGLPFGCSKEEIAQFFTGLELVPNGIMLPEDRQGRSTGEAYVQFASQEIAEKALLKHKERIGHRYIEIFKSSLNEATMVMNVDYGGMSKPRPLMANMGRPSPYDRNERFMNTGMGGGGGGGGMSMGGGGYGRGRGGRNLKGFYDDDYEDDMGYGGGSMGRGGGMSMGMNRRGNMRQQRMGGGGGGGGGGGVGGSRMGASTMASMRDRNSTPGSHYFSKTGHSVHMRGLPFQAIESDIADFFSPLVPVNVEFEFNEAGRPTGEANVDFSTHQEALDAMKKHKCNMEHRYIELFLNSTPGSRDGGFNEMDFRGEGGNMGMMKGNLRKGNMSNYGMDGYGNMGGGGGGGGGMNRGRMSSNYTPF